MGKVTDEADDGKWEEPREFEERGGGVETELEGGGWYVKLARFEGDVKSCCCWCAEVTATMGFEDSAVEFGWYNCVLIRGSWLSWETEGAMLDWFWEDSTVFRIEFEVAEFETVAEDEFATALAGELAEEIVMYYKTGRRDE